MCTVNSGWIMFKNLPLHPTPPKKIACLIGSIEVLLKLVRFVANMYLFSLPWAMTTNMILRLVKRHANIYLFFLPWDMAINIILGLSEIS